jgi:hypothetical protein
MTSQSQSTLSIKARVARQASMSSGRSGLGPSATTKSWRGRAAAIASSTRAV